MVVETTRRAKRRLGEGARHRGGAGYDRSFVTGIENRWIGDTRDPGDTANPARCAGRRDREEPPPLDPRARP